jgi:hypothetical protein
LAQETSIFPLLLASIYLGFSVLGADGLFILKVFDCFMHHTIDILAILSSFYAKVYITKPQTSRYANSEKYLVCKGFLHKTSDDFSKILRNTFVTMTSIDHDTDIRRFLNIPLSLSFTSHIEEYNAIFGQQQIENIHYTLSLMENKNKDEKIDTLIKTNVNRSTNWCIKYNIPHWVGILDGVAV